MVPIDSVLNRITEFWQLVLDLARSFTFKDIIDVLLVTLLIYGGIKLIRESRAMQLVKGIILIMIVYIGADLLELQMISSLLTYIFQFAMLSLLIIFQPEIRSAIERIGRSDMGKNILGVFGYREKEDSSKEIKRSINAATEAVGMLQQMRMGALIIFERKTKLGEIAGTGTIVNAEPTGQLIGNIFFNKAPLHDGAMIIRGGKVHAAGCILPLTKNDSLSAALGTRHRAALGMSEQSDAVVVVVSEETAQISIAVNGVLTRNYTRESLRDALTGYLVHNDDSDKKANSGRGSLFSKKRRS